MSWQENLNKNNQRARKKLGKFFESHHWSVILNGFKKYDFLDLRAIGLKRRKVGVVPAQADVNKQLVFLPSYSPNLNLIERLWKFVKKQRLYSKYYSEFTCFRNAIIECLEKLIRLTNENSIHY